MATQRQISDHVSNLRANVRKILDGVEELDNLRAEYDALGLSGNLDPEHFQGDNEGLTGNDIADAYNTHSAIKALFAQGHATNLYKVK